MTMIPTPTTDRPTDSRINGHRPVALTKTLAVAPDSPADRLADMDPDRTDRRPTTVEPTDRRTDRALARIAVAERKAAAKRADRQARDADRQARRAARRAARATDRAARWQSIRAVGAKVRTVAPLLVVNGAAVYGQIRYAYDDIAPAKWDPAGRFTLAASFAAAVESIAVYVGWHAHDALLNKAYGTAQQLRRASYGIAAIVGVINYAHFAGDHMAPTGGAVAFGLLSLLSPWLWGLHTRRAHHLQLLSESTVMDRPGVVFDPTRVRAFPWRSWQARRWSIDRGVTDPQEAWVGYNAERLVRTEARRVERTRREVVSFTRRVAETAAERGESGEALDALRAYVAAVAPTVVPTPSTDSRTDCQSVDGTDKQSANRSILRRLVGRRPDRPGRRLVHRQPAGRLNPVDTDNTGTPGPTVEADKQSARRPTVRRRTTDKHSPSAVANAAILRGLFPKRLTDSDSKIRADLGWSYDRLKPAKAAYLAGADLAAGRSE